MIISGIPKKSIKDMPQWKETFKNKMVKDNHWISKRGVKAENIEIKNNKLFRAPVVLPASVLPGEYKVKILHLRDGLKISEENTNIFVRKLVLRLEFIVLLIIIRLSMEYLLLF